MNILTSADSPLADLNSLCDKLSAAARDSGDEADDEDENLEDGRSDHVSVAYLTHQTPC